MFKRPPCWLGYKPILRRQLVLHILVALIYVHDFFGFHLRCRRTLLCECGVRARIVFHNVTSEYNPAFVFLNFGFQLRIFWDDSCPSAKQNELFFALSVVHSCFGMWYFHCLKHGDKLVHEIEMTQWIEPLSCNAIFIIFRLSSLQAPSRRFVSFHDACILWSGSGGFFVAGFCSGGSGPCRAWLIP